MNINEIPPELIPDYELEQINHMFRITDISKPLCMASNIGQAVNISKTKGFTRVPIADNNRDVKEYYDDKIHKTVTMELGSHVLSDGLGVLKAVPAMVDNEFYFVLTGNKITKFLHFSDLNSPSVSIGLFTQLNYLEVAIRKLIRSEVGTEEQKQIDYLSANLPKYNFDRVKKQYYKKKKRDAQMDPVNELFIDDELILAKKLSLTQIDEDTIKNFTKLRNSLVHSSDIVRKHEDVRKWLEFLNESMKIIQNIRGKFMAQPNSESDKRKPCA